MIYCKQSTDLVCILKNKCKSIKEIHQIHAQIITRGLLSLHPSSASRLLTTILHTFNSLLSAHTQPPYPHHHPISRHYLHSIFNLISNPLTFCWNTIISHTLLSFPGSAVFFFVQMRRRCLPPDAHTFTWNAMLVGLAMHGHGETLLSYFSNMVMQQVKPDGVTFLGFLVGCSHAGLINEARRLFDEMESVYGIPRELKHYGSMADLLGRAGLIKEEGENEIK